MNHKPVYYIEAIRLIKFIALQGDSKLEGGNVSENVNPWITLTYRDITVQINHQYSLILINDLTVKCPIERNIYNVYPLAGLTTYLFKIFETKNKRKQKYLKHNSLELYHKHLSLMKKRIS